jgi:hypothetical protein
MIGFLLKQRLDGRSRNGDPNL